MAEDPDYILDLSDGAAGRQEPAGQGPPAVPAGTPSADAEGQQDGAASGPAGRRWIGVHFQCCDVYSRIWRNREGTAYVGHCPRCGRKVRAAIGSDGVDARFFRAGGG